MSAIILEKLAEYTADLERIQDAPHPVGYGSDLSCADDLDANLTELDGSDPLLIAQSAFRRITTARGTLEDDPDYGIDIREDLSRANGTEERRSLAGRVRAEISKDERIASVTVTVVDIGAERSIEIIGVPENADNAEFRLVVALEDGETLLKEIAAT